ncbi:GDA1/CD39 nucleoside phosphatase family protein [Nitzschia inconspicua]|uniref:GDA1/CD39 nucleoside phosphatase family protein n=1 Tax=Nitzschia inconspicua TaxID=303405 RepID=A0A9K3Q461_9STRA|nr:GDA1/CD39 nucleoside phosphatase family protein [Nitzschia inconspicua]
MTPTSKIGSELNSKEAKHPLEATKSWELHVDRRQSSNSAEPPPPRRILKKFKSVKSDEGENGVFEYSQTNNLDVDFEISHKPQKGKIPKAGGSTMHGMMIDAGSQGTRIHIYEFDNRVLHNREEIMAAANGEMLSIPRSNSRWTDKFKPGLDVFASYQDEKELTEKVAAYLGPLIQFAKQVLKDKQDDWKLFPIYLKATGGLRTLPTPDRVRLINVVRKLFRDDSFNPFSFEDERARVISGEEEGAYGWVAVNYIKGTLVEQSLGAGTVLNPQMTYGMVEMGGASTQIGFFENNGDVMANLFKLQLGGARHWNIYTHSFLYFGVNGAWSRLNAALLWKLHTKVNPCLPVGSSVNFESWIRMNENNHFLPRSSPESTPYSATMFNNVTDFDQCSQLTFQMLRTSANEDWVEFSHDGDCSFAGVYQPPLPREQSSVDEFIATSNYADIFAFLKLGERASISKLHEAAKRVCLLDWQSLQIYNKNLTDPITDDYELSQFCFRSIFAFQILRNGYRFADDFEITAVDVLKGQKLGWALGSILYEINTLPWKFHPKVKVKGPKGSSRWTLLGASPVALLQFRSVTTSFASLSICVMAIGIATALIALRRGRRVHYEVIGSARIR